MSEQTTSGPFKKLIKIIFIQMQITIVECRIWVAHDPASGIFYLTPLYDEVDRLVELRNKI